ncbi:MAG: glycosyltransferase family 2 protein, partial [Myxococcales bacterium]
MKQTPVDTSMSVLLVNWNSREDTLRCLASLEAQGASSDGCEVILVDNGSTDGSVEAVRARFPRTLVVAENDNLGFAEGCNRGLAVATRPWVFTLNNDAELEPGGLATLRRELEQLPATTAALQPCLVFRDDPTRLNSTGVEMMTNGSARDRGFNEPRTTPMARDVFCPTAGAAVYRRTALDQVRLSSGVFDRTFFMYVEDVDLGWRLQLAGWSTLYL